MTHALKKKYNSIPVGYNGSSGSAGDHTKMKLESSPMSPKHTNNYRSFVLLGGRDRIFIKLN